MIESTVQSVGRVLYIEPSDIKYDEIGNASNPISHNVISNPYENYNMFVELTVERVSRYACGMPDETGKKLTVTYSSNKGTISFMGGTNGYLTTNFTDVDMTSPTSNTQECLGINSISISYDSWLYPKVQIQFVDVRGASLMLPSEDNMYNSESTQSGSFYESLFAIPQARFTLSVKGYYGDTVSWSIMPMAPSIRFDASTGNFIIDVEFIAEKFASYADIPMSYLLIAPYLSDGYWEEQKNNGRFVYEGPTGTVPMYTFPELRLKIDTVSKNIDESGIKKQSNEKKSEYSAQSEALGVLINGYPMEGWKCSSNNGCDGKMYTILNKSEVSSNYSSAFEEKLNNYYKDIQIYNQKYDDKITGFDFMSTTNRGNNLIEYTYEESVNSLMYGSETNFMSASFTESHVAKEIKTKETDKLLIEFSFDENGNECAQPLIADSVEEKEAILAYVRDNFYKAYEEAWNSTKRGNVKWLILTKISNGNCKLPDNVLKEMKKKKAQLEESIQTEEVEYQKRENQELINALGFAPTVRNMYKMAFAHLETFMHYYYSCTNKINSQINSKDDKRKLKNLNSGNLTTDVRGEKKADFLLPPYTAFYVETEKDGAKKMEEQWMGNYPNGTNLEEVNFVEEFMKASHLYNQKSSSITDIIEARETLPSSVPAGKDVMESRGVAEKPKEATLNGFIPITNYDLSHMDGMINPYLKTVEKAISQSQMDIAPLIAWTFLVRTFYNFCAPTGSDRFSNTKAYLFGCIEAMNLFRAMGYNSIESIKDFITNYIQSSNGTSAISAKLLSMVLPGCASNEMVKKWNLATRDEYLFAKNGDEYEYNGDFASYLDLSENDNIPMLPMYVDDITKFQEIVNSGGADILTDGNYFSTTPSTYGSNSSALLCDDDGNFLTNLVDKIIAYVDEVESLIDDSSYTKHSTEIKSKMYGLAYQRNISSSFFGLFKEYPYSESEMIKRIENNKEKQYEQKQIWTNVIISGDLESVCIKHLGYVYHDGDEKKFAMEDERYTGQTTIEAKAYAFLMMLPWNHIDDFTSVKIYSQSGDEGGKKNGTYLKAFTLLEGAYYWRKNKIDTDGIDPIKVPNNCATVDKGHLYMSSVRDEGSNGDWRNGIYMDTVYSATLPYEWKEDKKITSVRKTRIMNYFVEWARNSFAEFDDLVSKNKTNVGNTGVFNKDNNSAKFLNYKLLLDNNISSGAKETVKKISDFVKNTMFGTVIIIDPYDEIFSYEDISEDSDKKAVVSSGVFNNALKGFLEELKYLYASYDADNALDAEGVAATAAAESPKKVEMGELLKSPDLRLSTYRTMKNLYDKWLCSTPIKEWTLEKGGFSRCYFIDSFYHDISDSLIFNATKISDWANHILPSSMTEASEGSLGYGNRSFFEFLTEIAQTVEATFRQVPLRFGELTSENVADMFRAKFTPSLLRDTTSSFLFIYTYKNANKLGNSEYTSDGMNLVSSDGRLLSENEICSSLSDSGYMLPAFGVTIAKQNQSLFTNVTIDTTSHGITEASLEATFNIAAKGSENPRETTLFGQDIYRVYAGYSYQCTVEMLGNAQIYPLMYFQLNNIPMFRGVYIIYDVKHEISEGRMMTIFSGNKVNRYAIPLGDANILTFQGGDIRESSSSSSGSSNSGDIKYNLSSGGLEDTNADVLPTPGRKITQAKKIDFNESDITEKKPLICITPAHGVGNAAKGEGKYREHAWSVNLIDNYIIPKLGQCKFSDGTSYSTHIQRCNKDNQHATKNGYSMIETRDFIAKYGSKKVISVVPHWNASSNGKANNFFIPTNYSELGTRADTERFIKCFETEVREFTKNIDALVECPKPFVTGNTVNISHMAYDKYAGKSVIPMSQKSCKDITAEEKKKVLCEGTCDGACRIPCACILSENFFATYNTKGKSVNDANKITSDKDANGRFVWLGAWLESEEGLNAVADYHVKAIKRYIDSL